MLIKGMITVKIDRSVEVNSENPLKPGDAGRKYRFLFVNFDKPHQYAPLRPANPPYFKRTGVAWSKQENR